MIDLADRRSRRRSTARATPTLRNAASVRRTVRRRTPEYNHGFPGYLKPAIDSRPAEREAKPSGCPHGALAGGQQVGAAAAHGYVGGGRHAGSRAPSGCRTSSARTAGWSRIGHPPSGVAVTGRCGRGADVDPMHRVTVSAVGQGEPEADRPTRCGRCARRAAGRRCTPPGSCRCGPPGCAVGTAPGGRGRRRTGTRPPPPDRR